MRGEIVDRVYGFFMGGFDETGFLYEGAGCHRHMFSKVARSSASCQSIVGADLSDLAAQHVGSVR